MSSNKSKFRRFEVINEDSVDDVERLVIDKLLTHEDLLLILRTIKLNPGFSDIS